MGEWCATNLRDIEGWKASGLPMTTTSNECARMFDATLRQLLSWIKCEQLGGIDHTMTQMSAADPEALLPRCFTIALQSLSTSHTPRVDVEYKKQIDKLIADSEKMGTEREKLHAQGAALYANGEMRKATEVWERILSDHPNDLMALKFAHDGYFFMGDSTNKRDSVAKVIDRVRKDEPCYSYLHGMYAFGLEECGQYKEAEEQALKGLSLQKQDCWSTHARAHCMEMNGRTKEGARFLEGTVADWEPCYMLATHNYWHNALFYIEDGDKESVISIFDKQIGPRQAKSHGLLDYVDAASILWRLELEGFDVGKRWKDLFSIDKHLDDHVIAFNDVHFGPALIRRKEPEKEEKLRESLRNFITTSSGDNRRVSERVGAQLFDGMHAFANERFDEAARLLLPIRDQIVTIGGSAAQRDVFTQTLLHACLNARDKQLFHEGLIVLAERDRLKKNSGVSARLAEKFKERMRACL
ncbi:unnamed protein product, partial [Mesorhabditis belari]|uniref:Tetratricopeptide repeat protein 38 n=1 Tax=Mesorhabditis belari TaxID=2138241 RepID=A0AAF3J2U2_9BILA